MQYMYRVFVRKVNMGFYRGKMTVMFAFGFIQFYVQSLYIETYNLLQLQASSLTQVLKRVAKHVT